MIVTTALIPKAYDAFTVYPFVFIRPQRRNDAGLIAHEMTHYYRQRARLVLPWWLRYWLSRNFRWQEEVAGYRAQIKEGTMTAQQAAALLLTYDTGRSAADALAALTAE